MKQRTGTNPATVLQAETAQAPKKLTLLDFAEIFLTLSEESKREVLGYAKCLYANTSANRTAGA